MRAGSAAQLEWLSDDEFRIDGITYACRPIDGVFQSTPERFCLRKGPDLVRRIERMLAERKPRTIVELGVFQGGSSAMLAQAGRLDKLVCFDIGRRGAALEQMLQAKSLSEIVRPHWGVDQADTDSLRTILAEELDGAPIDLVIDDASHLLEPTRASFEAIFPLLRPGGAYVIEDWAWAHGDFNAWPEETPLTSLIFELTVANGHRPEVVAQVEIDADWVLVTRGPADLDESFDLLATCGAEGRGLLAARPSRLASAHARLRRSITRSTRV